MKTKRVLLVESNYFIGGVIHSLFERHESLNVTVTQPEDPPALLRSVRDAQPDIVVLDDTMRQEYLDLLLEYSRQPHNFQIVIVNANSNQVEVYQKQRLPVQQSADFFAML